MKMMKWNEEEGQGRERGKGGGREKEGARGGGEGREKRVFLYLNLAHYLTSKKRNYQGMVNSILISVQTLTLFHYIMSKL